MGATFSNLGGYIKNLTGRVLAVFPVVAAISLVSLIRVRPCLAQFSDTTAVESGSFVKSTGNMQLNQAAGLGNQEVNFDLVTQSPTALSISQREKGRITGSAVTGSASITGNAFAQSSGVMQVTQASGAANMLANAAFVGVDGTTDNLNPVSLSQVSYVPVSPNATAASFQGQAAVAPTAFAGVTGVVQVDQTAGNNNVAANQFSLHFEPGTVR
jgi:hypothetical protein